METDTKILYIRRLPAWLEFIVVDAMKKHDMKKISNSKVKEKQLALAPEVDKVVVNDKDSSIVNPIEQRALCVQKVNQMCLSIQELNPNTVCIVSTIDVNNDETVKMDLFMKTNVYETILTREHFDELESTTNEILIHSETDIVKNTEENMKISNGDVLEEEKIIIDTEEFEKNNVGAKTNEMEKIVIDTELIINNDSSDSDDSEDEHSKIVPYEIMDNPAFEDDDNTGSDSTTNTLEMFTKLIANDETFTIEGSLTEKCLYLLAKSSMTWPRTDDDSNIFFTLVDDAVIINKKYSLQKSTFKIEEGFACYSLKSMEVNKKVKTMRPSEMERSRANRKR